MEGFLTIHQLSTQFNVSARAIRGRLAKLVAAGKLIEHRDFERVNYIDANHFEWRVNPVAFLQASGLTLAPVKPRPLPHAEAPVNAVAVGEPAGSPLVNQEPASVSDSVNADDATVPQREPSARKMVHQPVNEERADAAPRGFFREVIDLLKDQIGTKDRQIAEKDRQIADLTIQNKTVNDLNKNLTGKVIQLGDRIEELLSLPAKAEEKATKSINVDEARDATVHQEATPRSTDGEPATAETPNTVHPQGTRPDDLVNAVNDRVNAPASGAGESTAV